MKPKHVFKGILTVILLFLLYIIILATLIFARDEFMRWNVDTFDDAFSGIECTKERDWWLNLLTSGARNAFSVQFILLGSGLLTLITSIIMAVIKRIKQRHIVKIAIFSSLVYFVILNLLIIARTLTIDTNAIAAGVTNKWEYWIIQSLFFSPPGLLYSEILTLITVIVILVIQHRKL